MEGHPFPQFGRKQCQKTMPAHPVIQLAGWQPHALPFPTGTPTDNPSMASGKARGNPSIPPLSYFAAFHAQKSGKVSQFLLSENQKEHLCDIRRNQYILI